MMHILKSRFVSKLAIAPAVVLAATLSFAQSQGTKNSGAKESKQPESTQTSQSQTPAPRGSALSQQRIAQEVNHELVMLPWYSVYDNLQYKVNGSEVTLQGQVLTDRTKEDAEKRVKGIEGVTKVNNNIELLPASPNDDRIRRAEYRAIFGDPALEMYSFGSVQPVHIIVKNGHVTLEGNVLNEGHKNLITARANAVPGVFSVTNNLKIENSKTESENKKQG
jgi:hyperosmotically inducible protein